MFIRSNELYVAKVGVLESKNYNSKTMESSYSFKDNYRYTIVYRKRLFDLYKDLFTNKEYEFYKYGEANDEVIVELKELVTTKNFITKEEAKVLVKVK